LAASARLPLALAQDAPGPNARPTEPENDAFSLWLNRNLRQAYDAVAAEPIPDVLKRLLEQDWDE
jgi:hypothetical protein